MKTFVYILHSATCRRTYVGQSAEPEARLYSHNAGKVRSTKSFRPWKRIYLEECEDRSMALKRELWFKTPTGRRKIAEILSRADSE